MSSIVVSTIVLINVQEISSTHTRILFILFIRVLQLTITHQVIYAERWVLLRELGRRHFRILDIKTFANFLDRVDHLIKSKNTRYTVKNYKFK